MSRFAFFLPMLLLLLSGCKPEGPIGLRVNSDEGQVSFTIDNNTTGTLRYSGYLYAQAPARAGDFYIVLIDKSGHEIHRCQIVDRPRRASSHLLAPNESVTIVELQAGLFDAYCLDKSTTYRLRVDFEIANAPHVTRLYSSEYAAIRWRD